MPSTDTGVSGPTRARIPARTLRQDRWWLQPLAVFVVFTAFVVFAILTVDNILSTLMIYRMGFCPDNPTDYLIFNDGLGLTQFAQAF